MKTITKFFALAIAIAFTTAAPAQTLVRFDTTDFGTGSSIMSTSDAATIKGRYENLGNKFTSPHVHISLDMDWKYTCKFVIPETIDEEVFNNQKIKVAPANATNITYYDPICTAPGHQNKNKNSSHTCVMEIFIKSYDIITPGQTRYSDPATFKQMFNFNSQKSFSHNKQVSGWLEFEIGLTQSSNSFSSICKSGNAEGTVESLEKVAEDYTITLTEKVKTTTLPFVQKRSWRAY